MRLVPMMECCGRLLELSEEGTKFRSYYDGRLIVLTPESSVQAQVRPSMPAQHPCRRRPDRSNPIVRGAEGAAIDR